jgi:3-hydroxyisobutyrate dehydrogenase-like beta-hydroxyacid dehydrogenase
MLAECVNADFIFVRKSLFNVSKVGLVVTKRCKSGASMLAHDFAPGGRIKTHHKDLGIILELGRMYGVSLPVTAQVDQMFASLVTRGWGDLDHTALLTYLEDLAAHRVG